MNDVTNNTVPADSRNMAVLMYILSIFFGFIPSLIFFLIKKDDQFVYRNAAELLNFCITMTVLMIGIIIISTVAAFIPGIGFLISMLLSLGMMVVGIAALVFLIMGALKVKDGEDYTFPFAIRLLK